MTKLQSSLRQKKLLSNIQDLMVGSYEQSQVLCKLVIMKIHISPLS